MYSSKSWDSAVRWIWVKCHTCENLGKIFNISAPQPPQNCGIYECNHILCISISIELMPPYMTFLFLFYAR